jgi:hypothetical protein
MNLPKFDGFAISVSNEELEASKKKPSISLKPGRQTLTILDAEYKGPVQADNSWLRFVLILGTEQSTKSEDGKYKGVTRHSVMVPTKDIKYNGKNGVFFMLQEFMDGLGELLDVETVPKLIPAYFSDFKQLVGLKLDVTLGYKKPYIDYKDGKFFVVDKNGQTIITTGFDSREAAQGQAITDNIDTDKSFIEVLRVHPGPKQRETAKPKKQRASSEW